MDCGAMCMPGAAEGIQSLVDDAVAKGAKVGPTLLTLLTHRKCWARVRMCCTR